MPPGRGVLPGPGGEGRGAARGVGRPGPGRAGPGRRGRWSSGRCSRSCSARTTSTPGTPPGPPGWAGRPSSSPPMRTSSPGWRRPSRTPARAGWPSCGRWPARRRAARCRTGMSRSRYPRRISLLYGSLLAKAERRPAAGGRGPGAAVRRRRAARVWRDRGRARETGMAFLEEHAGYVRTGYHRGVRAPSPGPSWAVAAGPGLGAGLVRPAHLPRRGPAAARAQPGAQPGADRGRRQMAPVRLASTSTGTGRRSPRSSLRRSSGC